MVAGLQIGFVEIAINLSIQMPKPIFKTHFQNPFSKPIFKTHFQNPFSKPIFKTHFQNPFSKPIFKTHFQNFNFLSCWAFCCLKFCQISYTISTSVPKFVAASAVAPSSPPAKPQIAQHIPKPLGDIPFLHFKFLSAPLNMVRHIHK
ncbi:hypothetical protein SAMN02745664_10851 [Moraxella cuniculi DSM 21768]|uniref:Uncharacterized protein n=1 Tax=Moraxella cuniculi DSM 21768 TaxID=1122245 RepID=A0A1N7EY45_9GAMM|nr:hypothetical protein SAMN02745664_10851 [Moraxella cuniculi DSM 21768]